MFFIHISIESHLKLSDNVICSSGQGHKVHYKYLHFHGPTIPKPHTAIYLNTQYFFDSANLRWGRGGRVSSLFLRFMMKAAKTKSYLVLYFILTPLCGCILLHYPPIADENIVVYYCVFDLRPFFQERI